MKNEKLQTVFIFVAILWFVFLLDLILKLRLNSYGIHPRTAKGLMGIVTSPFLHADVYHLLGNSIPLIILGILLVTVYDRVAFPALAIIVIVGGGLVWLLGRSANHIGASGIIYGMASFLIVYGIMKKKILSILVTGVVVFLYGGTMISGILPLNPQISWEGHLFSAAAGVLAASILSKRSA